MTTTTTGTSRTSTTTAALSVVFASVAYVAFLAVSLYAVAFVAGVVVPRTVDGGGPSSGTAAAVVVDVLLLTLFAAQHSVMARPAVKRALTSYLPAHLLRAAFVFAASAVLALTFWQWRPVPGIVWAVHAPAARGVLWALYGGGWLLVVAMTFAIDHLDFLGLRQVHRFVRGQSPSQPPFRNPLPYRLVRHPMMVGFFPAFLATPVMTGGHLLFALLGCGYIVLAVRLEERDLAGAHPEYAAYAVETPRFFPRCRRDTGPQDVSTDGIATDAGAALERGAEGLTTLRSRTSPAMTSPASSPVETDWIHGSDVMLPWWWPFRAHGWWAVTNSSEGSCRRWTTPRAVTAARWPSAVRPG